MPDFHSFHRDPSLDARLDFSRAWNGTSEGAPMWPDTDPRYLLAPSRLYQRTTGDPVHRITGLAKRARVAA